MHKMPVKKILGITAIVITVHIFSNFLSLAYAWVDVYSKNDICERLDPERIENSFTLFVNRPPQKNRILIPKLPVTSIFGFTIEMVVDDNPAFLAMRYGTPADDYPANAKMDGKASIFTHINPKNKEFSRLTDLQEKDAVIAFVNRWNSTMNVLHYSNAAGLTDAAGDYLYLNLFGNRQRVFNLVFLLRVNTQEALAWCQQGSVPLSPQITTESGTTWFSPSSQSVQVSSTYADKIYWLQTMSDNPAKTADNITEVPSKDNYTGIIENSSGSVLLQAPASGSYRQYKLRFAAYNDLGKIESGVYTYTFDLRPVTVGNVTVLPPTVFETDGRTLKVDIKSENSARIYYTKTESTSQNDPEEPGDPRKSTKYLKGPKDSLMLETASGVEKKVWVSFAGYNENDPNKFGEVSNTFKYTLKGIAKTPGAVSVDAPDGETYTSRQTLNVKCQDATTIHWLYTTDGSTPNDPKDELHARKINGSEGQVLTPGQDGRRNTVKLRFRGHNSNSDEWGPDATFTYTIDLTGTTTKPTGKDECLAKGDVWFPIPPPGRCISNTGEPQKGNIRILIEPDGAAADGRWMRRGSQKWRSSGEVEENINAGKHEILFMDVHGWKKPDSISVAVVADETVEATGTYTLSKQSGLTLYLEPQQAINDGARWGVIGMDMRKSGATIELNPGTYELTFEDIDGWVAPKNIRIEMVEDVHRNMIVNFKRPQNLSFSESIPSEIIQKSNYRLDNAFRNPETGHIELDLPLIEGLALRYFMESLLSNPSGLLLDWWEKQGEIHISFKNDPRSLVLKLTATGVYTTDKPKQVDIDKYGDWLFIYDRIAVIFSPVWADLSVRDILEKQLSSKIEEQLVFIPHNSGGKGMVFKFDFEYQDSSAQPKNFIDEDECFLQVPTESGKQQTFIPFIHDFDSFEKLLNDYGLRARVLPYPHPGQVEILTHDYQFIYKGTPDCQIDYNRTSQKATLDILNDQNDDGNFNILFISPMGSQIIYSSP